eukprot:scaffold609_cov170-Amphora_coffeaeformis.AAC.32
MSRRSEKRTTLLLSYQVLCMYVQQSRLEPYHHMSISSTSTAPNDDGAAVFVGTSSDFPEGQGRQIGVSSKRAVAIFRYQGALFAIDHHCYHMGGPLAAARDIEELSFTSKAGDERAMATSHACITCPWHKYTISLITGEALYRPVVPRGQGKASISNTAIQSKGVRQRIHQVWETDNHEVYVRINGSTKLKYESDHYASQEFRDLMSRKSSKTC